MRNSLLIALACARLCSSLGYEYFTEDSVGCICAEHVDSLRSISNFKAKLIGDVVYSEHKPEPKLSEPTPPADAYESEEEEN